MGKHVRSATALASGHVQLGVLDSQRMASEFTGMASDFRRLAVSLDKRLKEATTRIVEMHQQQNRLQEFIEGKKPVIKQGEKKEELLTITKGEATVIRQTDKIHVPLANLCEGDFFGLVPFLDIGHEPYSAMVLGSEDLEVSPLDPGHLSQEYNKLSQTFRNFIDHTTTCLSVTTALTTDIFKKGGRKKPEQS